MKTNLFLFFLFFAGSLFSQEKCGNDNSWIYSVEKLNINSTNDDYAPFFHSGKLYFVSNRERGSVIKYSDESSRMTDIYSSEKKNGKFLSPSPGSGKMNSLLVDGPVVFSRKGDLMIFSGSDRSSGKKEEGKKKLKIYISVLNGSEWSDPELLSFQKKEFNYCHPALSMSGQTLVFSSDMNNGAGMDLFISRLENGKWTEPVNAGAMINSGKNEVFPSFGTDGKFYFSSDRRSGDLDIFRSPGISSEEINLLGSPFNSASDDFGFWTDSTGMNGYFSSNREGNDDNIYSFKRAIPVFGDCKPLSFVPQCFNFFEEGGYDTTSMEYEWDFGDGNIGRGFRFRHCYSRPGKYEVKLKITDHSASVDFTEEIFYHLTVTDRARERIEIPENIFAGEPVLFSSASLSGLYPSVNAVYWEFSDGTFCSGDSVYHSFTEPGNHTFKILLSSADPSGEINNKCYSGTFIVRNKDTGFNPGRSVHSSFHHSLEFCIVNYFPQIHDSLLW